jgi:N-acetylglucosamine-6-phosphate deacetylase
VTAVLLSQGTVLTPQGERSADVLVADGVIAQVAPGIAAPRGAHRVDASGCLVSPGYIDLQCNGGHGIDLAVEPERMWELGALLPRHGVTAWLPTIVSTPA